MKEYYEEELSTKEKKEGIQGKVNLRACLLSRQ